MRDKMLGMLLLVLSVFSMVGYFWWVFLAPKDLMILDRSLRDWALVAPILIIVYAFLFIVAWIGKTMASTPPPLSTLTESKERKKEDNNED